MAFTPECQNEDGNNANFIGTNLDTGDTITLCYECMPAFFAGVIETLTGISIPRIMDEIAQVVIDGDAETPTEETAGSQDLDSSTDDDTSDDLVVETDDDSQQ